MLLVFIKVTITIVLLLGVVSYTAHVAVLASTTATTVITFAIKARHKLLVISLLLRDYFLKSAHVNKAFSKETR